jgi:hypothetical protein
MLAQTKPDYSILSEKQGIQNLNELKAVTVDMLKTVDLNLKRRDFEHLLFNKKIANEYFQLENSSTNYNR